MKQKRGSAGDPPIWFVILWIVMFVFGLAALVFGGYWLWQLVLAVIEALERVSHD